jgi:hypothetical protein
MAGGEGVSLTAWPRQLLSTSRSLLLRFAFPVLHFALFNANAKCKTGNAKCKIGAKCKRSGA